MTHNKLGTWNKAEITIFVILIIGIFVRAIRFQDSVFALISAICGITYTVLAGKGTPYCYLFGICGSAFYGYLSFDNALWGNLVLYICYYIPMQTIGFFQWKKHLGTNSGIIKKEKLSFQTKLKLSLFCVFFIILSAILLYFLGDPHPLLDSVTTIVSILGMYLTVKRVIEQWIAWFIVNFLSCLMWINVLLSGEKVYPTVIMWSVYLFLSVYFYIKWKSELNPSTNGAS